LNDLESAAGLAAAGRHRHRFMTAKFMAAKFMAAKFMAKD